MASNRSVIVSSVVQASIQTELKQVVRQAGEHLIVTSVLHHMRQLYHENAGLQARHWQVAAFRARVHPSLGEAPALSSPLVKKLVHQARLERAADLVVLARSFDQKSRRILSFPPLQVAAFNVLASITVEAGATGKNPQELQ